MKQGIVKFSKEFITPTGLKEWLSLEWDVNEPFDEARAMETFMKVKEFVCSGQPSSQGLIDNLNNFVPPGPPPIIQKQPEDRLIGLTPELIASCEDIATLQTFYLLVDRSTDETLKIAYKNRKDQLVAKETKEILDATEAHIQNTKKKK